MDMEEAFSIGNEGSEDVADGGRELVLFDMYILRSFIEFKLLEEIFRSMFISLSDDMFGFKLSTAFFFQI